MREKTLEQKLMNETKKRSGLCLKFVSPGITGVPDRIILLPDARIGFVEVKGLGEKPRKIQIRRHEQIRHLGFGVYVLDQADEIERILDEIQST